MSILNIVQGDVDPTQVMYITCLSFVILRAALETLPVRFWGALGEFDIVAHSSSCAFTCLPRVSCQCLLGTQSLAANPRAPAREFHPMGPGWHSGLDSVLLVAAEMKL
jgi:hypothetical protein